MAPKIIKHIKFFRGFICLGIYKLGVSLTFSPLQYFALGLSTASASLFLIADATKNTMQTKNVPA